MSRELDLQRAERQLIELLTDLAPDVQWRRSPHDERLTFSAPTFDRPLAVVSASDSRPTTLRSALRRARSDDNDDNALPVVAVPHITAAGAETLRHEQAGWIDLAGNVHLRLPGLLVHVEGRRPHQTHRGRPQTLFGARGSRITRRLLIDPERRWTQQELAEACRVSAPTVSRIINGLVDADLVARGDDRRYWVPQPGRLLDAWAAEYRLERHEIVGVHLGGSGLSLAHQVAERLSDLDVVYALTGLPAAWVYDSFAQFRLTSVYVKGDPLEVAEHLGARTLTSGANLQLIAPNDVGVFDGAHEMDQLRCVHPVQAYLDLLALPERAQEAAEHLRADVLQWP